MRTFISIDLPKNIQKEIKKIQEQLPEFKGKFTEEENLHLTLKFLGEIDEEKLENVKEKLNKISFNRFNAEINSIGVFSENYVRIVWLKISNCEKLQKEIDLVLEDLFKKEERFMGHLTIARVKSLKDKKVFLEKLRKIKIPLLVFQVKEFNLKKSILTKKRAFYEILETYRLN